MERREFFKSSILSGLLLGSVTWSCQKKTIRKTEYAKDYLKRALNILRGIEKYETPKLIQGAIRAAELYKAGGKLYSHVIWGHSPIYETRSSRPGNPNILPQWGWDISEDMFAEINKGDFLFANDVTKSVKAAKSRGAYIVGVSVPYLPNKNSLKHKLIQDPDWNELEDVANIVVYSHVPQEDGLVNFPEYPMIPLCPGSAISQFCYYWMMTAEIMYHLRETRKYPFISKAREYLIHAINLIHDLHEQLPIICEAAVKMTENVAQGGQLYVYDAQHTLTSEACGRASGLMMTKAMDFEALKQYDNVIFGSELSNAPEDIELVQAIKEKGAYVISISPLDTDGDILGNRLHQFADIALNDLSGESDGVVTAIKNEKRICPTSGLMNVILLWALTAQFIGEMIQYGLVPYVNMGLHLKGGREFNDAMQQFFLERGF